MKEVDFLVIGSGIAGLAFAIKAAQKFPDKKVLITTKAEIEETNTRYAQGGIASVTDTENDSFEKHIEDTLIAGAHLCDEHIVRLVVEEAPERIRELIDWGVNFDSDKDGFHLCREGGHSAYRILHHKDITGAEIQRALIQKVMQLPNIELRTTFMSLELIIVPSIETQGENICRGAFFLDQKNQRLEKILASATILATGGVGQVYQITTNPAIATGDGIAMAYRAGAQIENMEFIQFHPTALYNPGESPAFLISEAVRGAGAILKTCQGTDFMPRYDSRGSLAPRDIVARAITTEIKNSTKPFVYLDARHLNPISFEEHFPYITQKCRSLGLDLTKDMIPVAPAAHYCCGGIKVNEHGQSTISHLYACGECASTGLHGANRLASNSLLEAVVFAHRIFEHATKKLTPVCSDDHQAIWFASFDLETDLKETIDLLRTELQKLMGRKAGIVRSKVSLKELQVNLQMMQNKVDAYMQNSVLSPQLIELNNLLINAALITKAALKRKESVGLHFMSEGVEYFG